MRISDWSSDVCSSDLGVHAGIDEGHVDPLALADALRECGIDLGKTPLELHVGIVVAHALGLPGVQRILVQWFGNPHAIVPGQGLQEGIAIGARCRPEHGAVKAQRLDRSEEHTSELQSLMRISYAVFCLIK